MEKESFSQLLDDVVGFAGDLARVLIRNPSVDLHMRKYYCFACGSLFSLGSLSVAQDAKSCPFCGSQFVSRVPPELSERDFRALLASLRIPQTDSR